MIFTAADRVFAETLFARVARATAAPGGGICRSSYGRGETIALQLVAEAAVSLGLHTSLDAACNLMVTKNSGPIPRGAAWIGSHLDSVPCGGNYDGLAGVVAALLLVAKSRELNCALRLVGLGLRGEESAWFGTPYLSYGQISGMTYLMTVDETYDRSRDRRRDIRP